MNVALKLLLTAVIWLLLVVISLFLVKIAWREHIRVAYDDDPDKLIDMTLYLYGGRGILLHGAAALYVAVQFWKTL